ncbi:MAG: hypothetical protein L0Y72_24135 [Gemmataceae bacterium]|nr:hypothetical protein [Gemmataceae bacterium]MCI0742135.1 hypothetical protein [Gemmataceae bacterium]
MKQFTHVAGALYRVMEGVPRAKAAALHGHSQIRAEIIDASGQSQGEGLLPLDALRSPKSVIRRITPADETRWNRAVSGAMQAVLPYPAILVQPCGEQGTKIEDIGFDFGGSP